MYHDQVIQQSHRFIRVFCDLIFKNSIAFFLADLLFKIQPEGAHEPSLKIFVLYLPFESYEKRVFYC